MAKNQLPEEFKDFINLLNSNKEILKIENKTIVLYNNTLNTKNEYSYLSEDKTFAK